MRSASATFFHHRALLLAADYIEGEFARAGLRPDFQTHDVHDHAVRNIEVEIQGSEPDPGTIVVGAHYDSVHGSPGANDNATGVGAGAQVRVIAEITEPKVIAQILEHIAAREAGETARGPSLANAAPH